MGEFCQACGSSIPDWDGAYWARNMLCLTCFERKQYEERHQPCMACGARLRPEQLTLYKGRKLCNWCLKDAQGRARRHECAFCGKWIERPGQAQKMGDGRPVCPVCVEKNAQAAGGMRCYACGEKGKYPFFAPSGKVYCEHCAEKAREKGEWAQARAAGGGEAGQGRAKRGAGGRPLFSRVVDTLKHALAEE